MQGADCCVGGRVGRADCDGVGVDSGPDDGPVIRVAAVTTAQFPLMAAQAVAWAATIAAQWLIAMGPIDWIILTATALVALIIAK
ncbi:hypothetical protein [Streptomyces sp. 8ZJF_21]|uniref:hypothetical protein n=1 Tax=Streptomyces sp. 8ZJF_21 TaxID=2903141 RepID=UPI001E656802|nr:hypothetical protein [Streptomyces sp. 8ZJF_21]MCD9592446.1 hypothetical protein [Streptomyces sp. 8ZJF_21]